MNFTEELQNHLKISGWFKGRRITKYDAHMEYHNYPEFIREFIREFGDLRIKMLKPRSNSDLKDYIRANIDPSKLQMGEDTALSEWEEDIGRKLYGIGRYSPETFDIVFDEKGYVYFIWEYCVCVGKNIYDGIEGVIRGDTGGGMELDGSDPSSGIWYDFVGEIVDFDTHEIKYRFKK